MRTINLPGRFANLQHHAIMRPHKMGYHMTHNIHADQPKYGYHQTRNMHEAVVGEGTRKMTKPLKFRF